MTKRIYGDYANLSPRERHAIQTAAYFRGDKVESERVAKAAPRTWRSIDDMAGTRHGVGIIAHATTCKLLETAGMYWRFSGTACGLGSAGRPEAEAAEQMEFADKTSRVFAYEYQTTNEGWLMFCQHMGLDPMQWRKAMPGEILLELTEQSIEGNVPTPEEVRTLLHELSDGQCAATGPVRSAKCVFDELMELVEESEAIWA